MTESWVQRVRFPFIGVITSASHNGVLYPTREPFKVEAGKTYELTFDGEFVIVEECPQETGNRFELDPYHD